MKFTQKVLQLKLLCINFGRKMTLNHKRQIQSQSCNPPPPSNFGGFFYFQKRFLPFLHKPSLGSCEAPQKKFGPNRFSRFYVYWIQTKTNKQTHKQSTKRYGVCTFFWTLCSLFSQLIKILISLSERIFHDNSFISL